jgi:hypothetical protein
VYGNLLYKLGSSFVHSLILFTVLISSVVICTALTSVSCNSSPVAVFMNLKNKEKSVLYTSFNIKRFE